MSASKNDHAAGGARGPNGAEAKAGDPSAASIDKVRDILFGGQVREFDRRFSRLEDRLLKETSDLKDHLKARLEALEKFTKKETDSLADQIKAEKADRVDSAQHPGARAEGHGQVARKAHRLARRSAEQEPARTASADPRAESAAERRHPQAYRRRARRLASEAQHLRADKADRATHRRVAHRNGPASHRRRPADEDAGGLKLWPPRPQDEQLSELRSLIVGPEQRELLALQAHLLDPAAQPRDVSRVLPDAIALRADDPQLTHALAPSIEDAVTASVRRDPRAAGRCAVSRHGPGHPQGDCAHARRR